MLTLTHILSYMENNILEKIDCLRIVWTALHQIAKSLTGHKWRLLGKQIFQGIENYQSINRINLYEQRKSFYYNKSLNHIVYRCCFVGRIRETLRLYFPSDSCVHRLKRSLFWEWNSSVYTRITKNALVAEQNYQKWKTALTKNRRTNYLVAALALRVLRKMNSRLYLHLHTLHMRSGDPYKLPFSASAKWIKLF